MGGVRVGTHLSVGECLGAHVSGEVQAYVSMGCVCLGVRTSAGVCLGARVSGGMSWGGMCL